MCFAPQRRPLFRHLNFQKCSEAAMCLHLFNISTSKGAPGLQCFVHVDFKMCFALQRRALFQHLHFQTRKFFTLLTSKCASRHNGVHFFDMSTSKSGLRMVCFAHFDFKMCFAPQRRAILRNLNFQKCSEPVRFSHF